MRKIVSLLVSAAMLLTWPLSSLAEQAQQPTFVMAGFDGDDSSHNWETNKFFTLMQQKTGVGFTFKEYTNYDEWQKEKQRMFAQDDLPDVFFKGEFQSSELIRYTESGQLIDLKPLLPEYAPNLWKLLEDNPEWLASITLPSGKIGALPRISPQKTQNAMWINKTWLDYLGLDMPTDADSLYAVLTAFKTKDPNQNGRQDEIPLTFLGAWDLKFLAHAFGLVFNDYNIYVDESGKVNYAPLDDRFFEFVSYLRKLYSEGLLLSNGFNTVDSLRIVTDQDAAATYGLMLSPTAMTYMHYSKVDQYTLLDPLEYGGKRVYRDLIGNLTRGTFAITKNCTDPGKLLSWVDTLYTEEGGRLALAGEEGVDYVFNEDGTWAYTEDSNVLAYTIDEIVLYNSGNMPWLFPSDFESQYALENVKQVADLSRHLSEMVVAPFPNSYTLTLEQEAKIVPMQQTLGNMVDMWLSQAVMGQIELTQESFDYFKQDLQANALDEFVQFWQGVYDGLAK